MRTPGVSTRLQEVLERLDERQAHVLLLQGEPDLGGERLLIFVGGEAQRLREAQAGLERHDQEVDQVGQRFARSGRGASAHASRRSNIGRTQPSTAAPMVAEERAARAAAGERREPEREERAGDGAEELRAEEALGRRVVHPGRRRAGRGSPCLEGD